MKGSGSTYAPCVIRAGRKGMVMGNQKGGIISKLFVIPVGVAFMVGFFFLGYYVGKYQARTGAQLESLPPLPDVAKEYLPKKEDFTFYKTLTDKGDKTVSLDLTPTPGVPKKHAIKKKPAPLPKPKKQSTVKPLEVTIEKAPATQARRAAPAAKKREEAAGDTQSNSTGKQRYSIQIASYPERNMAEEEVRRMKKRGYAAYFVTSEIPDKGTWYRVRIGRFKKKRSAERLMNKLQNQEGLTPYITAE